MSRIPQTRADFAARARKSIGDLVMGGDWAIGLAARIRQNLVWYWFDGFFAAACDNIVVTYLTVYLLSLGATGGQIGLLSSFSSLTGALALLLGALIVERTGRRKQVAVFGGGGVGRLALLSLALAPFFLRGPSLVIVAITFAVLRDFFINLSFPAWMAITADIIPLDGRGRYFASRNFAMGIAGIGTTLLVGLLINQSTQPGGYQMAFAFAFGLGVTSTLCFARLVDPAPLARPPEAGSSAREPLVSFTSLARDIANHRAFFILCAAAALWNLSLNIAGPFFNVYLVQNLNASTAMVGLVSISSSGATLFFQRWLGVLTDRWGARRLQMVCGLAIPLLPLAWVFVREAWQVIPINLVGGVLWAGYNLASFNYLLTLIPADQRARYSALYQFVVVVSLAAGAALGSLVVTQWGYTAVFLGSAAGRIVAAVLFATKVKN